MSNSCQQVEYISNDDSQSESLRLKAAFSERMNIRLKDENAKQAQKITKLCEDVSLLQKQKNNLQTQLSSMLKQLQQNKIEKQGVKKRLQLRQQRYESQKNQFLLKQEQQALLRHVKQNEEQLQLTKNQSSNLMKKCHTLLLQLEQVKIQKAALEDQLGALQIKLRDKAQKTRQLEKLYGQKIEILQAQNYDFKKQSESLILQLQLFERHKQIESLLTYEKNIGLPKSTNAKFENKNLTARTAISKQQVQCIDPGSYNNFPQSKCCCLDLQDELIEKDQLIELLKQKNKHLLGELQSSKRRCSNLQGIICSKINDKV